VNDAPLKNRTDIEDHMPRGAALDLLVRLGDLVISIATAT
jgi:hypothetical protein